MSFLDRYRLCNLHLSVFNGNGKSETNTEAGNKSYLELVLATCTS